MPDSKRIIKRSFRSQHKNQKSFKQRKNRFYNGNCFMDNSNNYNNLNYTCPTYYTNFYGQSQVTACFIICDSYCSGQSLNCEVSSSSQTCTFICSEVQNGYSTQSSSCDNAIFSCSGNPTGCNVQCSSSGGSCQYTTLDCGSAPSCDLSCNGTNCHQ